MHQVLQMYRSLSVSFNFYTHVSNHMRRQLIKFYTANILDKTKSLCLLFDLIIKDKCCEHKL